MDTGEVERDSQPNSATQDRRAQLERLSLAVSLDTETQSKAQELLDKFYQLQAFDVSNFVCCSNDYKASNEHYWPVCAVYCTSVKVTEPCSASCISLSQLLRAEKIRFVHHGTLSLTRYFVSNVYLLVSLFSFFQPLETFLTTLSMTDDLPRVKHLKWKFVTMNLLFAEYSRLYTKYFFRNKRGGPYVVELVTPSSSKY